MRGALFSIALAIMMAGVVLGQSMAPIGSEKDIFTAMFAPGVSMTGVQSAPGTIDKMDERRWGNSFVVRGGGEWFTSQLTMSMDYDLSPADTIKGNPVVAGSWSMVIHKEGAYLATYYGDIKSGNITWSINPKTGVVNKRTTTVFLSAIGTIDGDKWTNLPTIVVTADTRLDGNVAFTTATMDLEF